MPVRRAYAKVNLALAVGPPLPVGDPYPGMHPIASWMHAIDLYDEVEVIPGGSGLTIEWAADAPRPSPIDWPSTKDLTVRALALMQAELERGPILRAAIRITKRIPAGAGLGGGSSDAAATLLAVNDAFSLRWPADHLLALARQLGSDVAFFLDDRIPPRPALVTGLGERVTRLIPREGWLVLILPEFGCPTGAVYKAYDALHPRILRDAEVQRLAAQARIDPRSLFNDLRPAAEAVRPDLRVIHERASAATGASVHMSGSGSTLFVLAGQQDEAHRAERALADALGDSARVASVRLR